MLRTLAIMIVAGWAAAGTPFRGDQALFALYAKQMNDGKILYRDLWDVTNPGIFWFYQLAGSLFGFSEDGIHFAEWLWFTAFVLLLGFAMVRRHALDSWPQSPALFVGAWYFFTSCADPSHLTKAEGLVAFPLFAVALLLTDSLRAKSVPERMGTLFLAGFAAGLVVLLKLAFALPLIAVSALPLIAILRQQGVRNLVVLVTGAMVPIAILLLYFLNNDALGIAAGTLFVTPREMLAAAETAPFARMASSGRWFIETGTPLIVLAVAGSLLTRHDPLVRSYWCLLPAALIVILIQRWSWWSYHFLLLSLPLAVLAAYTWPVLKAKLCENLPSPRERLAAGVVIALLFLAPLGHGLLAYSRLLPHRMGITGADRAAARLNAGNAYRIAATETDWLRDAPPGQLFVAGDPLVHWLSGRPVSGKYNGWSLELFTPALWADLQNDLALHPPRFIFVDRANLGYESLLAAKAPALVRWIENTYRIDHVTKHGTWYEHRPLPPEATKP